MNKVVQLFFLVVFPLYPLWSWIVYSATKKPLSLFVMLILVPLTFYYLLAKRLKVPKYLIFIILFTIFHLVSVIVNGLIPSGTNIVFFLLSDINVFACFLFLVIESTTFDSGFITRMGRLIFLTVIITAIVSIIQIKFPYFFISPEITGNLETLVYLEGQRCFSIFSWVNLNSLGISFPIMIGLLLSIYSSRKNLIPISIISGILVSFLTRSRYVMISVIIVLSQLFINSKIALRKKVSTLVLLFSILLLLIGAASMYGFDIQQIIDTRILEKDNDLGSAKARILSYEVFMAKFPEYPWLGVGPQTRADVVRLLGGVAPIIHIGYLSYLYYYGLIGCFLLFMGIFYLLKDAWKTGKDFMFWGSFYGLLSFCFANLTFVYFNLSEMGIVLAIVYMKYFKDMAADENSDYSLKKLNS